MTDKLNPRQHHSHARMLETVTACTRYVVALNNATGADTPLIEGVPSHEYLRQLYERFSSDTVDSLVSALFKASRVPE